MNKTPKNFKWTLSKVDVKFRKKRQELEIFFPIGEIIVEKLRGNASLVVTKKVKENWGYIWGLFEGKFERNLKNIYEKFVESWFLFEIRLNAGRMFVCSF